ncbi:hypothetical protein N4P33_25065 [Streptomyces sp. 15-116A]|uniref:hypothetical protein n=1 Tax=Streptomyces sp. 15-116A TaxID=2259035 RepID=UPI0021B1DA40|nr:hypothetical protein [Streptomyces sp. 15-116A]MCT7355403.1 hypothetical protein [Streptomyces sp. 15-116A]
MTQTVADSVRAGSPTVATTRARRVLRAVAVASCVPYLSLKVAWLAGSHLGIPDGSPLLEHRTAVAVANGVTVLMDACVIVLALVLTRPWGLRLPAWLLAVPVWVATGLLTPIMTGFPVQLVVSAFGGSVDATDDGGEPFLHSWVFCVVYGGFLVQGLALGALFALYARDRWGRLWQGRLGDLPCARFGTPAQRTAAVAAAVVALLPLTAHLLWACGATTGLNADLIADRTSDFHVVEAQSAVFVAGAAAAGLMLGFRRGRAVPVRVPLALAWITSAAVACWAGWQSVASLVVTEDASERPTALMQLTYAGQTVVGLLVAGLAVRFLVARSKAGRPAP